MKLITEEISNIEFITEGKGKCKKCYIEGVFLQGGIKNRNGRMYPTETLAREVGRYNESFVTKGRALVNSVILTVLPLTLIVFHIRLFLLLKKETILKEKHNSLIPQWVESHNL